MNIQELKKKMAHVPDHKMYHDRPMTSPPKSKSKAVYNAKEGGSEWRARIKNQEHRLNQMK